MIESTPQAPQPTPVHEEALQKIRMLVGEHFDGFLLVVSKNGQRWSTYKTDDEAFGMASFIVHTINKKWWESGNREVK